MKMHLKVKPKAVQDEGFNIIKKSEVETLEKEFVWVNRNIALPSSCLVMYVFQLLLTKWEGKNKVKTQVSTFLFDICKHKKMVTFMQWNQSITSNFN